MSSTAKGHFITLIIEAIFHAPKMANSDTYSGVLLTDAGDDDGSWTLFTGIVTDMRSLKLLHFFMDSAVKSVVHDKVLIVIKAVTV